MKKLVLVLFAALLLPLSAYADEAEFPDINLSLEEFLEIVKPTKPDPVMGGLKAGIIPIGGGAKKRNPKPKPKPKDEDCMAAYQECLYIFGPDREDSFCQTVWYACMDG